MLSLTVTSCVDTSPRGVPVAVPVPVSRRPAVGLVGDHAGHSHGAFFIFLEVLLVNRLCLNKGDLPVEGLAEVRFDAAEGQVFLADRLRREWLTSPAYRLTSLVYNIERNISSC